MLQKLDRRSINPGRALDSLRGGETSSEPSLSSVRIDSREKCSKTAEKVERRRRKRKKKKRQKGNRSRGREGGE